jgi:DNA primase catalytic core
MARIPESELERLKVEVRVEELARARGIELRRHGADLVGLCPFHDDHEPSLVISPGKNLWHCLGACGTGGTAIDWVMRAEGISFRHAVELLRAGLPALAAEGPVVERSTVPKLAPPVEADADDRELLTQVVDYYHETLKQSPEALAYLEKRGLRGEELIGEFRLGFANRTLGYRLPEKNRKAGAELRGRLSRLGVLRESGHEHFNGSLVIPVFDSAGAVVELYGRKITPGLREGTPAHLYLPGPHRGVWNEAALAASKEIILCESLIDALTFWCAGYRHVTASYGVNGFTQDHRDALKKHGTRRVLIAYDADAAGDRAAEELARELMADGVECLRVRFPCGLDANDYALREASAARSLGVLLNQAEWLGQPARKDAEPQPETPSLAANGDELTMQLGDRRYRVRGLSKNLSYELLKVNLLAANGQGFHVDTLDLYAARQRAVFARQAADEMHVEEESVKRDLGRLLLKLEEHQAEQIRRTLEPQTAVAAMSEEERAAALALLEDPKLLDRILEDFARCGLVGEETNKLVGYLAAVSRHLERPLAVLIQSSSAAGKSSLMETVLSFVPEEERVEYSAMTGQSLFYLGETDLKHKVLAIVEEEGASRAAYALKLLQSEGVLSIASTGKDPATGRLVTHQYRVEGPVMIFLTTTAIDLDDELLNRCLVLSVDEDRRQTQAIHRLQREAQTLDGLLARQDRDEVLKLHRNAQRLIEPLFVANPYARELTFSDSRTRSRRDHVKYLTLIRAIALLHQHQRPVRTVEHRGRTIRYIEVTPADIETANRLIGEVLGRSLDELPPQTRRLLDLIEDKVARDCARLAVERAEYRFSRRDVRGWTEWGDTVLKKHLRRLEELEYLLVHRGGRGQSFVYELQFAGVEGHFTGLSEVYDVKRAPLDRDPAPPRRPVVAGVARGGRADESPVNCGVHAVFAANGRNGAVRGA